MTRRNQGKNHQAKVWHQMHAYVLQLNTIFSTMIKSLVQRKSDLTGPAILNLC